MIKAPFMALAIGVVACSEALKVKAAPSRWSAGHHFRRHLLPAIVLDGLFAIFFASIGT